MSHFQETLEEFFIENLDYELVGQQLPTPEIDGNENILAYSKEFHGNGLDIIVVECSDRIVEFQKKFIKNQKNFFPNAHFLFVSNDGKVFDLYNNSTSKKLKKITYDEIGRNTRLFKEKLQLFEVTNTSDGTELQINAEKAFDTSDKITKKFFDKFKKIHEKLQKAITGIEDKKDKSWYASVMMNRIMFIYFLQKHYVIQKNSDFLLQKFDEVNANGNDYYKDFLLPLFFYGFARRDNHPEKEKFTAQFGPIRYLNGGLFYPHHLEKKYSPKDVKASIYEEKALQTSIGIKAKPIKEILEFLNGYTWYLDSRPMKEDTDINPDVLGYIFEKYINQKELGAYYTKEDITEYISKNTIIPFILDKMSAKGYNTPDPNPIITNNEDIIGAIQEYIEEIEDFEELKYLYKDVLLELSVLDPAVGSGAFLFAALNILLPIYQKTIFKLKNLAKTVDDNWLKETLNQLSKHAEEYFLTKQIILNNLYGVDIVEEATEICKLRLFLQLASHLPDITSIEPLPDIDFNIYAGNSLVGGLSWDDIEFNYKSLFNKEGEAINPKLLKEKIEKLTNLKQQYREIQQDDDNEQELNKLKGDISWLDNHINNEIDLDIDNPFHWFIDFKNILEKKGFDVIIGNPPYVEYSKIKNEYEITNYQTIKSGNIYAYFFERTKNISHPGSQIGFIVQLSAICTPRMQPLQDFLLRNMDNLHISSFDDRPGKLFDNLEHIRVTIIIGKVTPDSNKVSVSSKKIYTTRYIKFYSEQRDEVFNSIEYLESQDVIQPGSILKIGSETELKIAKKLFSFKDRISNHKVNNSNNVIYYGYGFSYWAKVLDFVPYFKSENSDKSTGNMLYYVDNEKNKIRIISILNSSLFYWFYSIFSDGHNFTKTVIGSFPFKNFEEKTDKLLKKLIEELMIDLDNNSWLKKAYYKATGNVEYKEYYPKLSKNIIDEITKVLCFEYGLNDSETQFILNYDINIRMGKQNNE